MYLRNTNGLFVRTLSTEHRESSLYFQRLRVASFFICAWGELVMAGEWEENILIFSGHFLLEGKINCLLRDTQVCSWNLVSKSVKLAEMLSMQCGSLAPKQAKKKIEKLRALGHRGKVVTFQITVTWSHCQLSPHLYSCKHSEWWNGTFSPPKYFVYFHVRKKKACDLLVHLKPIKDLLALIKWHHFKG